MSASVKPEPVLVPTNTTAPVIDLDVMMEKQEQEIRHFYETVFATDRVKPMRPRWPMKEYLKRVIDRHIDLLERFGGWRIHSAPFDSMPLTNEKITQIIEAHTAEWRTGAVLYANNREKQTEKMAAMQLKTWTTEAEAIYCAVQGCCFPAPNSHAVNLWRSRSYTPTLPLAKEGEEAYASRTMLKIRAGQAVTRAVLAEVRKTFKDQPQYVKMWETLCEKMGVAWAASAGYPITLSFAPVDFLRCGHYGESNSCYRSGHQQEHSKYNLTMITNSVMGLIYPQPGKVISPMDLREGVKPAARCWGIMDLENEGALFSNLYLLYFNQVQPSLEAMLEQTFGWKVRGGMPTEYALREFMTYAYTNGDNNVFSTPQQLKLVQEGLNSQCKMTEQIRHIRCVCPNCATTYGHTSMLQKCACGGQVCEECSRKTACCGRASCKRCVPNVKKCGGCGKEMCGRCMDKNGTLTMCRDTGTQYCPSCAEEKLTKCAHCEAYTTKPVACEISGTEACPSCAEEKHRECNRCKRTVSIQYITRCSGCTERRCDECKAENETNEPRSLCGGCQEKGVEGSKVPEVNQELLAQFQKSIEALPENVREKYLKSMREFKWDLDEILLNSR